MPRNGFFGVKNSHFALVTDEDKLTYENPVHVAGTVEISMEPSVETATSYADNEPWIEKQQDDGGSGTMSFYDTESTPELRQLIADLVGYTIAADGRTILSANKKPKPFAFMCEQPGHVTGRRRCLLMCQLSKPSQTMSSLQGRRTLRSVTTRLRGSLLHRPAEPTKTARAAMTASPAKPTMIRSSMP